MSSQKKISNMSPIDEELKNYIYRFMHEQESLTAKYMLATGASVKDMVLVEHESTDGRRLFYPDLKSNHVIPVEKLEAEISRLRGVLLSIANDRSGCGNCVECAACGHGSFLLRDEARKALE